MIEIGADAGSTTTFLAEFAVEHSTVLHVVDPVPNFDVEKFEQRFAGHFRFYREKSHDALRLIGPGAAVVLIDGDHNWYTVHGELELLEKIAVDNSQPFPLVMLHDVEWPYARRDMYYDPEGIPSKERHPWSRNGVKWGQSLLATNDDEGIGIGLAKALVEGGARNGVLTAIEDFLQESTLPLGFQIVPGSNGLGVLVDESLLPTLPAISELWEQLASPVFLLDHSKRLASESMRIATKYMEANRSDRADSKPVDTEHESQSQGPSEATTHVADSEETDSEDHLVFHARPGSSDTAIVAFSARGAENGRFHFFELDRVAPAPAKLLVRDPSENWYNTGLPSIGGTVVDIAAAIEERVGELNAKRVLTIGSSMGGYAAILFGCMIQAERAIALVPQTLLDPNLPRRRPSQDVPLQVPDLRQIIDKNPSTVIDVVTALDDILDVFHAQRIASFPSVRVLSIPGAGHEFAETLNQEEKYYPLIKDLIDGSPPAVGRYEAPYDPETLSYLADAVFARGREDSQTEQRALIQVARCRPSWKASDLVAACSTR